MRVLNTPGGNQAGFPGPFSAESDFQQRALCDLRRALAPLKGVHAALKGPAGAPQSRVCCSLERSIAELPISNRERLLIGPLLKLLGRVSSEARISALLYRYRIAF